jgi:antibiotic biosynthesis monooxygenase (ABM) superfamily enzyme
MNTESPKAFSQEPVRRIVFRRAKPNRGPAFEELVRGMVAEMQSFKGFLGAEIIPPETAQNEHQFIFRWALAKKLWMDGMPLPPMPTGCSVCKM